jgi:hypothetical protein
MGTPEHRSPSRETEQRQDDRDDDELERDGAYERAQPDSQPTVSSEPEPDDDPTNAG